VRVLAFAVETSRGVFTGVLNLMYLSFMQSRVNAVKGICKRRIITLFNTLGNTIQPFIQQVFDSKETHDENANPRKPPY